MIMFCYKKHITAAGGTLVGLILSEWPSYHLELEKEIKRHTCQYRYEEYNRQNGFFLLFERIVDAYHRARRQLRQLRQYLAQLYVCLLYTSRRG